MDRGAPFNPVWRGARPTTQRGHGLLAEAAEEIKGASTIPINKGMSDVIVAYGMNGEPLRLQQGFPVRLIVPAFEGIFNTKWLRHIKVVDQYQLNMNDFRASWRDAKEAALGYQIGLKLGHHLPFRRTETGRTRGWYEITGLALVRRGRHSQGGGIHRRWEIVAPRPAQGDAASHGAHKVRLYVELAGRRAGASFAHDR